MILTGARFQSLVSQAFNPFLIELGFRPEKPHLSGKYYRANFIGETHTLIVTFEPADAYLTAMLVRNDENDLSLIDDPQKAPRLGDLNRMYMELVSPSERGSNESCFSWIKIQNKDELALVKCAKELRLVLPRYLSACKATVEGP